MKRQDLVSTIAMLSMIGIVTAFCVVVQNEKSENELSEQSTSEEIEKSE